MLFALGLFYSASTTICISVNSITEILYLPEFFHYKVTNSICFCDLKEQFHKLSEASPIPSYCYLWKGISSVISALLEASKSSSCSQVEVSGTDCSPWQTQPCRQGLTQTHSSSLLLSPLLAPLTYSELYDTAVTWVYSTYLPFPSSKAAVSSLILTEVPQFMTIFSWGSGLALAADSENSMQPSISNS